MIRIERHSLGPRVHVFGRRIHEYHVGLAILGMSGGRPLAAAAGLWLVVKDWPDLFPATRDKARWRVGLHRLPSIDARARDDLETTPTMAARPAAPAASGRRFRPSAAEGSLPP